MDPSYDVNKLKIIASLMDDIYATLANSTFIPHNAIARGPHIINTTAISCNPSASVLRLIELLPYVDFTLVKEPDWIDGGYFMDYRNPLHLAALCDPLRGEPIGWTDYMEPTDVALTNWGTGGWNSDRTFVMIYSTERNSIRIFDGELWVERRTAELAFGEEMNKWWFEEHGQFEWDIADGAPHILRAVTNNYKSLRWTPWGTSNREDGFGVPPETIKTLLERNGWPDVFNPTQFNVDFILTKHMPYTGGPDEDALERTKISRYLALQRTHEEASFTNDHERCVHSQHYEPSKDPDVLEKCMINKAMEREWLELALKQSQDEAMILLKETGYDLPPFEDVFQRARNRIAEFEQMIADRIAELERRGAIPEDQLPDFGTAARDEIEMQVSMLAHSRWSIAWEIERLEEEMAKLKRGETPERGHKSLFDYLRDYDDEE